MWILLHGPRHPLDDAPSQTVLEAVDQALRPADQDVGVRAQFLVGPSQYVSEVGPRAAWAPWRPSRTGARGP